MHTYFGTEEEWITTLYKKIPKKQSSLQADTAVSSLYFGYLLPFVGVHFFFP